MHALILVITLFLSNGQAVTHADVMPESGSRDIAMQACLSSIPQYKALVGAVDKDDPHISVVDVQGFCTFAEAGSHA